MEMKLIIREGVKFTQFKVPLKMFQAYKRILRNRVDLSKPIKQSTRFIYFECEGDLLNGANRI